MELHPLQFYAQHMVKKYTFVFCYLSQMEKLKEESMAADNGLQRPYLSTDEYPPYTGIPGTYPAMPYSSLGASRHLDGLEHGLSLDKRYNFGDLALQVGQRFDSS